MTADDKPAVFGTGDLVLTPSGRAARIVRVDAKSGEATVERLADRELITLRLRWLQLVEEAPR